MTVEPYAPDRDPVVAEVLEMAAARVGPLDVVYRTSGLDIAWISPSVTQALGWTPGELVGRPALDLISARQDRSWVDSNRHRLMSGRDVVQQLLLRKKDGGDLWFSGVARPALGSDGVDGFVVVLQPISELDEGVAISAAIRAPALDEVTGVEARHSILAHLDDALAVRADRVAVVVLELENLRAANESMGHAAGNAVLAEFARRIQRLLGQDERLGRVSGTTFMVVTGAHDPRRRVQELVAGIQGEIRVAGRGITPLVLSACVTSGPSSSALTMLRDADIAMSERAVHRFVIEDELRFALDANEFELQFQPIVALSDRHRVAAESLVRWRHPREGVLGPETFMPVAEDSRLVRPLGRQVLQMACHALTALPAHSVQIGVNVSAVELADDRWLAGVLHTIDSTGADPCCLAIELTETAVLTAHRDLAADLADLKSRGVAIFLDDFGTGYSSLSLLRDLPVTGIKLDKSFLTMMNRPDTFGAALTKGIIDLIKPLGLAGIAEGIETEDQAARLTELGWEFGQGYLFGRPAPLSSLEPAP